MASEKVKPENLTASERSPVIPVVKEAGKALKAKDHAEKALKKAEGKAADLVKNELNKAPEKPAQSPEAKPEKKGKAAKKATALTFPTTIRINDYGFVNLRKGLLEALGWAKGIKLKLDKNADGSVMIRKEA